MKKKIFTSLVLLFLIGFGVILFCFPKGKTDCDGNKLLFIDFQNVEAGILNYRTTKRIGNNAEILCGKKDFIFYMLGLSFHPFFIEAEDDNKFLSLYIPKNYLNLPGAQWKMPLCEVVDECWLSYKVKFDDNFDFVKGGKLPGMAGGTANTGGKIPDGSDGWSARMMFWNEGRISFYTYTPEQKTEYGECLYWKHANGDTVKCIPGEWHSIVHHIKLNSRDMNDGILEGFFDGERVYADSTRVYRFVDELKIDQLLFSVFRGGDDATWMSDKEGWVFFDDFCVSKNGNDVGC